LIVISGKKYGITKRVTSFSCETLSFEQAIKEFLTHLKATDRASSTIYSYYSNLKQLRRMTGNVDLLQITDTHLDNALINISASPLAE